MTHYSICNEYANSEPDGCPTCILTVTVPYVRIFPHNTDEYSY